jgi:hypothetical protein
MFQHPLCHPRGGGTHHFSKPSAYYKVVTLVELLNQCNKHVGGIIKHYK